MRQCSLRHFLAFSLLLVLYAGPALPSPSHGGVPLEAIGQSLQQALRTPAVLTGLALDMGTHLAMLLATYAALAWLARAWARRTGVRHSLALGVTVVLGWLWLVTGNGWLFSHSAYSAWFTAVPHRTAFMLTSGLLGLLASLALPPPSRWPWRSWPLAGVGIAAIAAVLVLGRMPQAQAQATAQRNVVIIGIDSLSAPLLQREAARLPHLSALVAQGLRYERAYTPLGRTFPAWVSILSGRSPGETGALFNLRGIEEVKRDDLLSTSLRRLGYRSVYAIDERRFNNIDETFGFDAIVGPQAGVLDFVLQPVNDTPLSNLLLQTRASGWLMPYSRLNVAAAASYDADGFVDEIVRSTDSPAPLFLATHFLSGHYPFATRHATQSYPRGPNAIRAHHVEALTAVDTQVGRLVEALGRNGRLEDTLVILLSDHGEALGDSEPVQDPEGGLTDHPTHGHGTDLLSEHQNRVVLTLLHYRHGRPDTTMAGTRHEQVSLLDVRAAAERFVQSGEVGVKPGSECFAVETELRLASAADYRTIDPARVAAEGISLYEIDQKGRLRLRESKLAPLIAGRDVGLRCPDRLTMYLPRTDRYVAYRVVDGEVPHEIPARSEDMERIRAYRKLLVAQASARPANRALDR